MIDLTRNQRGIAIFTALALIAMCSGIGLLIFDRGSTNTDLWMKLLHHDQVFWLANAGAERAIAQLTDSAEWRAGYPKSTLGAGCYMVAVADSTVDSTLGDRVRLISLGQRGDAARGVEVIMGPEGHHPLFDYAIYAGNYLECDSTVDSQAYVRTMNFGGTGADGDLIQGDVFFNGHITTTGSAAIDGSAEAGGSYDGNRPSAGSIGAADYLKPPYLQGMKYETTADFKVDAASPWDGKGRIAAGDPRCIFVRKVKTDLKPPGATGTPFKFSNKNYILGDPWEDPKLACVSVGPLGNNKTYFIDGNLWIGAGGTTTALVESPPEGTHITVVAKGNIYFSGSLLYDRPDADGLAFVATSDGESYDDQDGDSQYDEGEPIVRDDGDGLYEGPMEGSGNIILGDPNGQPLWHIQAFLYADNSIRDHVLNTRGEPLKFNVTGTLSAGGSLDLHREGPNGHAQLTVTHDARLRDGLLELPGLPTRHGGKSGMVVLAYREL